MTTFVTRSALLFHGVDVARDVAYAISDHQGRRVVTWSQVLAARRERQSEHLRRLREPEPATRVPCYLWTFFIPGLFYGGWWCYLISRFGCEHGDGPKSSVGWSKFAADLMSTIPLGWLPLQNNWKRWMETLASTYPRHHPSDLREAGSVVGWYDREKHLFSRLQKQGTPSRTTR